MSGMFYSVVANRRQPHLYVIGVGGGDLREGGAGEGDKGSERVCVGNGTRNTVRNHDHH